LGVFEDVLVAARFLVAIATVLARKNSRFVLGLYDSLPLVSATTDGASGIGRSRHEGWQARRSKTKMALCSIAIAAGIVGVVAVVKRLVFRRRFGHYAFAGGPCGGGPGFGYGGGGFRGWGRGGHRGGIGGSFWLRMLYTRLDTTPGQEREIRAAIEDLRDRAKDAKSGMLETRENLGKSIAAETFDDAAFEAVSARVDATSEKMKDALSAALKRIHAVLDPKQRERLADLVSRGAFGRWGRGGGGPYRSGEEL
jgi:Spy/CpxP family protein refolding chaperone